MLEEYPLEKIADFCRALANPVRLQIIQMLLDGEKCQCEIHPNIPVSQSTVSAYLSQLVRAGILKARREGQRRIYSIASKKIPRLLKLTEEILEGV